MSESTKPGNKAAVVQAYEHLLDNLSAKTHQGEEVLHKIADEIKQDAAALYDMSADEVVLLEQYVKRDIADATSYLHNTGEELKSWLGFDLRLIEETFWEKFLQAADRTTTALVKLKLEADKAGYHTGEIIGVGTLACDQCGEKLHFHHPGHIPPCPKCHASTFHRYSVTDDAE